MFWYGFNNHLLKIKKKKIAYQYNKQTNYCPKFYTTL